MSEAFELFLVRVDVVRRCKDVSTPRTVFVELGPLYPNVSDWMLLPIGSVPVYTACGSTSESDAEFRHHVLVQCAVTSFPKA
jgi:hypothetical protein